MIHALSMLRRGTLLLVALSLPACAWLLLAGAGMQITVAEPAKDPSEEALRLNNLGIAALEQFEAAKAVSYFEQALALDADFLPARVNLGIAYHHDRKRAQSEEVLRDALARDPGQMEALYVLALNQRSVGNDAEALKYIEAVLRQDPKDAGVLYFASSMEGSLHMWDASIRHARSALVRDPLNVSVYYGLARALIQKGDMEEAKKAMARFQDLQARKAGTTFGNQYGEQGRYALAIQVRAPGAPPDKAGLSPRPRFVDEGFKSGIQFVHSGPRDNAGFPRSIDRAGVTDEKRARELAAAYGSGASFIDLGGEGWPDLFLANASASAPTGPALYRNNRDGTFRREPNSGIDYSGVGMGTAAGDYDNDGRPDLFIAGFRGSALYHNEGNGRFREATALLSTRLQESWALSAAFADLDHDGDLDLFVTCGAVPPGNRVSNAAATNLVYRNNGDGSFTEIGESTGAAKSRLASSIALLDYNNSRDLDLLLVDSRLRLFSNSRDGSFGEVSEAEGLAGDADFLGLATADFDGDGLMDICVPKGSAGGAARVFWNKGEGFESGQLPVASRSSFWSARAFDYDNDGDADLLLLGNEIRLLENSGRRAFFDVSGDTGLNGVPAANARCAAVADYDRDGDPDLLITRCGFAPLLLRNDGGNRNHAFRLSLKGRTDNSRGIGSKVDWASGGLYQHREVDGGLGYLSQSATDLLLGLGKRPTPDFIRILWPTGVLQSEMPARGAAELNVIETDRKGTSCPILYTWDGNQYRFVSDFLGGCAMGLLEEPGRYSIPDTDEYIKITGDQLKPRGDRLSLKMVNQLEEIILFDMAELLAVDHPSEIDTFPNERLLSYPPYPEFHIFTASAIQPIVSAKDDRGVYWTEALRAVDRDYVRGFRQLPYKGYAEEHTLELDLGDLRGARRALLLLDGWIDYATSSANFAAAQAGAKIVAPYLQVWDAGRWRTVLEEMGFPAGLPKTITIDLTGKIPLSQRTRIRIVTNMCIYWDQIRLETAPQDPRLRITPLQAAEAQTSWVGYPRQWSPDGMAPFSYDFALRDAAAPWRTHIGNYTPFGDVRDLLESVDDRYVLLSHGEAITAEFSSRELPPLPEGWRRDWLLHVDGFGKDMDLHSEHPDRVEPLPRHRDLPYRRPYWKLPSDSGWESFRKAFLTREAWSIQE